MSTTPASELNQLLRTGRLDDLARALDGERLELDELDRHLLRGELARRRRAPLTDVVAAARAHRAAGTPHAGRLLAAAAQLLSRLGGDALAQRILGEVPPAPDDDAMTSAIDRANRSSDAAALARGRGDLEAAAALSAEAAAAAPDSDIASSLQLAAALDRWATGHPEALAALRAVRDSTAAPSIRRQAREVLDAIESEPGRAPSWLLAPGLPEARAGTLVGFLARALGVTIAERDMSTASHLRAALGDAGVATVRVVLDQPLLVRLLGEPNVMVLLEEEQSRHAAFLLVRGLEPTGGLILVSDPVPGGAILRPLPEQWRRSALAGRGALIINRGAPLEGITDDPRLALIDRCHFDPADPDVPLAHVAQLARAAIAAAPEIAMAHRRLGEALVGQLRLGNLDADERLIERWVAETRERFPDAEWAHQIYAEALEQWERWPEALIAWCDATAMDAEDDRNLMGQVRAARRSGGFAGGRHQLRRALAVRPQDAQAWAWLAEEELAAERVSDAELAADLAAALAPGAVPVVLLQASVAERRGATDDATLLLESVAEAPEAGQGIRLWRRYLCAGRWDDLRAQSERIVKLYPGSTGAWSVYMDALVALGDRERALAALFESLQRVSEPPIDNVVEILLAFAPPGEIAGLLSRFEEALGGNPDPMTRIARGLGFAGRAAEGTDLLERLARRHPDDPNVHYSLGQLRMRAGEADAARTAFGRAIELHEQFAWVRYLHGWLLLDTDPAASIEVASPVIAAAPVLFWDLIARALDRAGRVDDAAELRRRLPDVAHEIVEHAEFLRSKGLHQPLTELLELAAAERRSPEVRYQLALTQAAAGRHAEATDELLAAYLEAGGVGVGAALLARAAHSGRGAIILEHGPAIARECRRDSTRYADPWIPDAVVAAAAAAAAAPAPREELLARAGSHAQALRALARASRALGAPCADDDLTRLAAVAPGSASLIDHPEL
jgi:tetratricopeptide (TPR) repeat protein